VTRYQKGKTRKVTQSGFTGARDSEWHQLDHIEICTLPQTDNHTGIPPLSFLQAVCPSCSPTNSVKALKVTCVQYNVRHYCRGTVQHVSQLKSCQLVHSFQYNTTLRKQVGECFFWYYCHQGCPRQNPESHKMVVVVLVVVVHSYTKHPV